MDRSYGRGMADEWTWRLDVPRSVQIADEIDRRILAGELEPRAPIYETRLVQEFGVARLTARKATKLLRERGSIYTVRGMGSFVSSPPDS